MTQAKPTTLSQSAARRKVAFGVTAIFITQFASFLFINARNIAQPQMVAEFDGIALFSWLIALPSLAGSAATLLAGKLSDICGRRAFLLASMALFALGLAITTQATSMPLLVASATLMSIGHYPIAPLCFSAVGDLFSARELARWTGLLALPTGIAALLGPVVGGILTESAFGWRALYWGTIPLVAVAGVLVAMGLPRAAPAARPRVDVAGTLVIILAITALIFGVSRLGVPETVATGALLLIVSAAAWLGFIQIERRAAAPILDPQVLFNRAFVTAAVASFLSCFGMLGIATYSPIFVQGVMAVSPTLSGGMMTPYTMLGAFMGIPAGFMLARTGRFKWMYTTSYAVVTLCLVVMWRFTAGTPVWLFVLVTAITGVGLGTVPTVNMLVAQYAVPRRLLGVAVGGMFFFLMVGLSVAPAILGIAQNSAPDLEGGLQRVFLVGAVAMAASFLIILTIPHVSVDGQMADAAGG